MNLSAFALRFCAVKALTGKTLAGARVFDTFAGDVDATRVAEMPQFVVVSTDDFAGQNYRVRDMVTGGDVTIDLSIDFGILAEVEVEGTPEIVVPETDANREAIVGVLGYEIFSVLGSLDPWADLWRRFVMRIERIESKRGDDVKNGMRFASREFVLSITPIGDPYPGDPKAKDPASPWKTLLDLMDNDADVNIQKLAAVVRRMMDPAAPLPAWALARAKAGAASDEDAGTLPLATAGGDVTDPMAVTAEVVILGDPAELTVDAAVVEGFYPDE
jgi:hypothetical protein